MQRLWYAVGDDVVELGVLKMEWWLWSLLRVVAWWTALYIKLCFQCSACWALWCKNGSITWWKMLSLKIDQMWPRVSEKGRIPVAFLEVPWRLREALRVRYPGGTTTQMVEVHENGETVTRGGIWYIKEGRPKFPKAVNGVLRNRGIRIAKRREAWNSMVWAHDQIC